MNQALSRFVWPCSSPPRPHGLEDPQRLFCNEYAGSINRPAASFTEKSPAPIGSRFNSIDRASEVFYTESMVRVAGISGCALMFLCLVTAAQEAPTPVSISSTARIYLDHVLDLMQADALHTNEIDWPGVRSETLKRAAGAHNGRHLSCNLFCAHTAQRAPQLPAHSRLPS